MGSRGLEFASRGTSSLGISAYLTVKICYDG